MEGPISFWGYKEQESKLVLPEHDNDDDDRDVFESIISRFEMAYTQNEHINNDEELVVLQLMCLFHVFVCGPGSSVGIATGYGPDGPGTESR